MKFTFNVFVLLSLLINCTYANEDTFYVSPSQVHIGQNGIIVTYENALISVSSISCDVQGIYFNISNVVSLPKVEAWICPKTLIATFYWSRFEFFSL